MNFLDIESIKNIILNVNHMNVLDEHSKDLLANVKKGFEWNCRYGHLNIVKWLYKKFNIDIHTNKDEPFKRACKNGRINVAKWLCSIDINIFDKCKKDALTDICIGGHFDIAQWFDTLCPISTYTDDDTFGAACSSGNLNLSSGCSQLMLITILAMIMASG